MDTCLNNGVAVDYYVNRAVIEGVCELIQCDEGVEMFVDGHRRSVFPDTVCDVYDAVDLIMEFHGIDHIVEHYRDGLDD